MAVMVVRVEILGFVPRQVTVQVSVGRPLLLVVRVVAAAALVMVESLVVVEQLKEGRSERLILEG